MWVLRNLINNAKQVSLHQKKFYRIGPSLAEKMPAVLVLPLICGGARSFCQLGIFVNLPFFQLSILSTCHFVNLSFCQLGILSTCHFPNFHFVNMPFCQLGILSTWHFVNLAFCQLGILSTCHFVNLPFCQLAILSTNKNN